MIRKLKNYFFNKLLEAIANRRKMELAQSREKILKNLQSVGSGVHLNGQKWVFRGGSNIVIGNNVHIEDNAYIMGEGGLIIGDNTHISRNVTIYTTNHKYNGSALPYDYIQIHKPVIIQENVWIGMNVSIVPGIKIGRGAIVGMGTVVNRDVDDYEIVGPSKCETLKYRDSSHYQKLNLARQYGGINGNLLSSTDINNFNKSYSENRHCPITFILSTGRSGSEAIINTLNQNASIDGYHENIRQLIRLSVAYTDFRNHDNVELELKNIFQFKSWKSAEGILKVHSDQRLWNFVPFLKDYFSNSTFIHLVRHPYDTIRSMQARNWYADDEYKLYKRHQWAQYRLTAVDVGLITREEWDRWSQLQRIAWYYLHINSSIWSDGKQLREKDFMELFLEDLEKNIKEIQRFLKVNVEEIVPIKSNIMHVKHKQEQILVTDKEIISALMDIAAERKIYSEYLNYIGTKYSLIIDK